MKKAYLFAAAFAAVTLSAGAALADDPIPYPDSGSYNPAIYSFTAASDGDLTAYIVGGFSAGYENQLGLLVNGTPEGGYALDNHASSVGDSYDFGPVSTGDVLTFVLHNLTLGGNAYSNPALNIAYDDVGYTGGHEHVYSTPYTATNPVFAGVPLGTYVAFEDLPFPGADYNYNDESFVFSNTVVAAGGAPEPGAWALMLLGVAGLGGMLRAHRKLRALETSI